MTRPRRRGEGSVYQRQDRAGRLVWYVRWWERTDRHESVAKALGKPPEKVTQREAERLLVQRIREKWLRAARPDLIGDVRPSRTTVQELMDHYAADVTERKRREGVERGVSLDEVAESLAGSLNEIAAVKRWLGPEIVAQLTTKRLAELQTAHLAAGRIGAGKDRSLAPGTVRVRLDVLRAAWRRHRAELGLPALPEFPKLEVKNVRREKIPREVFDQIVLRLRAHDPADDIALFGYLTGWRGKNCRRLLWSWVDVPGRMLRLPAGVTKNREPLERPIEEPELFQLLQLRWTERAIGCPYVFHRAGRPVTYGWLNRRWRAACVEAGAPGRWFHDFRRTGYDRFMPALTLKETMTLIGHRSVSSAMRYQQPEIERLRAGLRKVVENEARERNSRKTRATGASGETDSPS